LPSRVRTKISVGLDVIPLGFPHASSRSSRIELIRESERSEHSLNRSGFGIPAGFRSSRKSRRAASSPPFELSTKISFSGKFAALLSSTVLLFVAQHTPRKLFPQVLFSHGVLRTNHVVLDLLCHSTVYLLWSHHRPCVSTPLGFDWDSTDWKHPQAGVQGQLAKLL